MGVHLSLTPSIAQQIADDVEAGVPLKAAAESRGIGESTVRTWLSAAQSESGLWIYGDPIDPDSLPLLRRFLALVTRARAIREVELAKAAGAVVKTGTKRDAMRSKGALEILRMHPSYRKEWGLHVDIEHRGTVDHRLKQLEQAPTSDLIELAPASFKALLEPDPDDTPGCPET